MRPPRSLLVAAMAGSLAGLLPLAAPAQVCPPALPVGVNGSQSLRLMTYNAFIVVTPADNASNFGDKSHADRAEAIANLVRADDPDVVAFNEVDAEEAVEKLIEVLAGQGPYKSYVRMIDPGGFNVLNDSGLMLFSKHPFGSPDTVVTMSGSAVGANEATCDVVNDGQPAAGCNQAMFANYQKNGADWFQNKAVGLVRILNTCNGGAPFNVAFAPRSRRAPPTARLRLRRGRHRSAGTALHHPPALGDVAQRGRAPGPTQLPDGGPERRRQPGRCQSRDRKGQEVRDCRRRREQQRREPGPAEHLQDLTDANDWELTFNSLLLGGQVLADDVNGGFYACRGNQIDKFPCAHTGAAKSGSLFIDTWAYNTSREDPGQTQSGLTGGDNFFAGPDVGERLDYILRNEPRIADAASGLPTRTLCAQ